jgi:hypothetical protein
MIVNDGFRVINKLETSLTGDARVVIDDPYMFIVQATRQKRLQACQSSPSVTKKKNGFLSLTPRANVIKLFTAVIYKFLL